MCVKEGATISAANFKRVQGILSNPVAFLVSTVLNNQRTFLTLVFGKEMVVLGSASSQSGISDAKFGLMFTL